MRRLNVLANLSSLGRYERFGLFILFTLVVQIYSCLTQGSCELAFLGARSSSPARSANAIAEIQRIFQKRQGFDRIDLLPNGTAKVSIEDTVKSNDRELLQALIEGVRSGGVSEIYCDYVYGPKAAQTLTHLMRMASTGNLRIYGHWGISHMMEKFRDQNLPWFQSEWRGQAWSESETQRFNDFLAQSKILEAQSRHCAGRANCILNFELVNDTFAGFTWEGPETPTH